MGYSLKAKCVSDEQSPSSMHVATLVDEKGEQIVLSTKDLMFVEGNEYTVSVDGKFVESAPPATKPPVLAPKPPIPPVVKPPLPQPPKPVIPAPKPPEIKPPVVPKPK
jgi:hypothetical protein